MDDPTTPLRRGDFASILSRSCDEAGGQTAWARKYGISVSQVCQAINGTRNVTDAMITALGYIPVERFVLIKKKISSPNREA